VSAKKKAPAAVAGAVPAATAAPALPPGTGLSAVQRALRKLGLVRDIDFALYLPMRYEDETRIVRLADNLGLRVVAEGIETAADRDLLAEMGCPYGQGFLYSAPLTSADAVRWAVGLEPLLASEHPTEDEYAHSGARPAWDRTLPS